MRNLKFSTFTKKYVAGISRSNSMSVRKLVDEALNGNIRLREPLFWYAVSNGKMKVLLSSSKGTKLYDEYVVMAERYSDQFDERILYEYGELSRDYAKVLDSYKSAQFMQQRDKRVRNLIRIKILEIKEQRGITTYKLCKNIGISRSGIGAWLNDPDRKSVSLKRAKCILEYLENIHE